MMSKLCQIPREKPFLAFSLNIYIVVILRVVTIGKDLKAGALRLWLEMVPTNKGIAEVAILAGTRNSVIDVCQLTPPNNSPL